MPKYSRRPWTTQELEELRRYYAECSGQVLHIDILARSLSRTLTSVKSQASRRGLGEPGRQPHDPRATITEPCACGCGELHTYRRFAPSQIARQGQSRFLPGHQNRGKHPTPEQIAKTRRPLEKNGRWKGGRIYDSDGYVKIKMPEHPYASKSGYVLEHRLVMEKRIGRYLTPDEVVHHINETKDDNRDENLMLLNPSTHNIVERTGKKFPRPTTLRLSCERCGVEFFRMPSYNKQGFTPRFCSWACRYPKTVEG